MDANVYYQKELNSTFTLSVDGQYFNTPIKDFIQIDSLVEEVDTILYTIDDDSTVIIRLSSENPALSIIIDVYDNGTDEEPTETYSILFENYLN